MIITWFKSKPDALNSFRTKLTPLVASCYRCQVLADWLDGFGRRRKLRLRWSEMLHDNPEEFVLPCRGWWNGDQLQTFPNGQTQATATDSQKNDNIDHTPWWTVVNAYRSRWIHEFSHRCGAVLDRFCNQNKCWKFVQKSCFFHQAHQLPISLPDTCKAMFPSVRLRLIFARAVP